jgi:hypothetical protein
LVEQLIRNQQVVSSSLTVGSRFKSKSSIQRHGLSSSRGHWFLHQIGNHCMGEVQVTLISQPHRLPMNSESGVHARQAVWSDTFPEELRKTSDGKAMLRFSRDADSD